MTPDPPPIERRRWSRNEVRVVERPGARPVEPRHLDRVVGGRLLGVDRELGGAAEEARLLGVELDQAAGRRGRGWPSSGPGGSTSRRE